VKRSTFFCIAAITLSACATASLRIGEEDAIAAAKHLVETSRPWASQATYTLQRKTGDWIVIVSCNQCQNPDGTRVAAEYVIRVDRKGKASLLVGLDNGQVLESGNESLFQQK